MAKKSWSGIDLSKVENSFTAVVGKLIAAENSNPTKNPKEFLQKIVSLFDQCNMSEQCKKRYKLELSKCYSYKALLLWCSSKWCCGSGNAVI